MPFYSLFLPFLLLLLPVSWLGYLLIFLVLVGIKPFFFFHNPNSILDAGGLVYKRREGTRYAILGDFSLFLLLLLLPFFPRSLRLPCSLASRAVRAAKHKLHETATSGTRLNTTVHKKFKAEEEQGPPKKKPQNTTQFWNSLQNFRYNPSFEEILKTKKKKPKNRQNFRRISTKVFFQETKDWWAAAPPPPPPPHGTLISWTTDFPSFQTEATTERRIRRPSCFFFLQAFHKNTNKREKKFHSNPILWAFSYGSDGWRECTKFSATEILYCEIWGRVQRQGRRRRRRGGAPPEPSCLFSYLSVALVGR